MAKVDRLTKLKSAMKRFPSLGKLSRSSSAIAASDVMESDHQHGKGTEDLQAVYVGKSRRRYYLPSDTISHPLFQELIDRSSSAGGLNERNGEVVVSCEVVLFEHLLWMLESGESQLGSMQELAEFYTC
ncbi:auxin-responsive protein SAUR78-like [Mangifera indica]|uniref:auxin-responsive protein SAUR78-like n=1 Tax=Mangifera indica TaxID=29780 RepID=UPI001CF96C4C|nr:auxin-responsive protein SAUR78-like [Mangifera indica]